MIRVDVRLAMCPAIWLAAPEDARVVEGPEATVGNCANGPQRTRAGSREKEVILGKREQPRFDSLALETPVIGVWQVDGTCSRWDCSDFCCCSALVGGVDRTRSDLRACFGSPWKARGKVMRPGGVNAVMQGRAWSSAWQVGQSCTKAEESPMLLGGGLGELDERVEDFQAVGLVGSK